LWKETIEHPVRRNGRIVVDEKGGLGVGLNECMAAANLIDRMMTNRV